MRRFSDICALLFFVMAMIGCDKAQDPVIINNLPPEYEIDMWEQLLPSKRVFQVRLSTIAATYCPQTSIDYDLTLANKDIKITVNGVGDQNCNDSGQTSPATSTFAVDPTGLTTGFYDLEFSLKDVIKNTTGQLDVSFDQYVLRFGSDKGVRTVREVLNRVPDDIIWGYVGYDDPDLKDAADDFISAMNALEPGKYKPGYYGHFRIEDNGEDITLLHEQINTESFETFTFQNVHEYSLFTNTLNAFQTQYEDKLSITIFTSNGDIFD